MFLRLGPPSIVEVELLYLLTPGRGVRSRTFNASVPQSEEEHANKREAAGRLFVIFSFHGRKQHDSPGRGH